MDAVNDLSKLCIHSITTRPWSLDEAVRHYVRWGVKGITVWRDAMKSQTPAYYRRLIGNAGMEVVSLCRGGFFPSSSSSGRSVAWADNRKAIDEAHELGAPMLVLVCGADPNLSLSDSRKQIRDGIAELIPIARAASVKLAIEPLHPMYADNRSAINTLAQANDLTEYFKVPEVGVAVDVYHLWWDPNLQQEIVRCGRNRALFAFHVCDWLTPTRDMLNDRGLMGAGCIPIRTIRSWVEEAGFNGFNEVEIFSTYYWKLDQADFLKQIINSYQKFV